MNTARRNSSAGHFAHIVAQGSVLAQKGQRLVVYHKNETLTEFPMAQVQGFLLYGDVRPSSGAIRLCFDKNISLTFLSRQGRFRGRLAPGFDQGTRLRLKQYERSKDAPFCLAFARGVVRGKLLSALAHLNRRRKVSAPSVDKVQAALLNALERAESARSFDELRGVEGSAAASYFQVFREWLIVETGFLGRQREHPDAVNALLNLTYTLIRQECEALLLAAGLDPAIGFYHTIDPGRPSLACDWQEEFRHAHADPLVQSVLNRKQVNAESDFSPGPDGKGLRLTTNGLRSYLQEYEQRADEWRPEMLRQLERLSDAISAGQAYKSCWEPL